MFEAASSTLTTIVMSSEQQQDTSHGTDNPSPAQQEAGNNDMSLGSMIKEAEEKGVKGALMSRLKKAKVGKVNLDPAIGESWTAMPSGAKLIAR